MWGGVGHSKVTFCWHKSEVCMISMVKCLFEL